MCEHVSCFTAALPLSRYIFFAPACTPAVRICICFTPVGLLRGCWTKAFHIKALLRHLALVFTGVAQLKPFDPRLYEGSR